MTDDLVERAAHAANIERTNMTEEQPIITQSDVELWRAGNAAALDAAGYVMDAEQCRQGQFDDLEPAKEFQREIARQRRATLTAIEEMMEEFVTNWPKPKKMKTALALIAKVIRAAINPASHNYWGAGEAECPSDIKAGNGELHTLRCKVCGRDNPKDNRCFEGSATSLAAQDGLVEALKALIPKNVGDNQSLPDDFNLPCDISMGEVRRARRALAAFGGQQ